MYEIAHLTALRGIGAGRGRLDAIPRGLPHDNPTAEAHAWRRPGSTRPWMVAPSIPRYPARRI